jgi:cytosine/adenosine deaminase-related metal-dependent hydrolase
MKILVHVRRGRTGEVQAFCPDLPGCAAIGADETQALERLEQRLGEVAGAKGDVKLAIRRTPSLAGKLARTVMMVLGVVGCANEGPNVESTHQAVTMPPTSGVFVNECSVGSGGYIELYNAGAVAVDLARDMASCWWVDDEPAGGAPKRITDTVVNHAPGSTTCSTAGRPAACGIVGPHERVWVSFSYVNSATPDQCRLLSATLTGGVCDANQVDVGVGGATAGGGTGKCYGRIPDAGDWQSASVTCTPSGASNGCFVGTACDDGDPTTTNDLYLADCSCHGTVVVIPDAPPDAAPDATPDAPPPPPDAAPDAPPPPPDAAPPSTEPTIADGAEDRVLLRGTVVGPTGPFDGELLVSGNAIACVAPSCSANPLAVGATVVDTKGIIMPGLIDAHNHGLFNIFDQTDWTPTKFYANHNQWTAEARYKQLVDAKQYLDGETAGGPDYRCEMDKWGELRAMVSGTTSMIVAPGTSRACFRSLIHSADVSQNGFGIDKMQTSISVPAEATAQSICNNFASGATTAYVVHIAEGIDATARKEFATLSSRAGGCLLAPQTTIVHGTALGTAEFQTMAAHDMALVWSPRSNTFLYNDTTHVELAVAAGVRKIALAPDWAIGGSANLLDELRYAKAIDAGRLNNVLGDHRLFDMVTIDAARAIGLDAYIGSLEVGKRADIMVIPGDASAPYSALLAAHPGDVRLVLVDGRALYGDAALAAAGPAAPGCETMAVEGRGKFMCVAETSNANLLDQTFAVIQSRLVAALAAYDATFLTPTTGFSPLTPLVPAGY